MGNLVAGTFIYQGEVYYGEFDQRVGHNAGLSEIAWAISGYRKITLHPTAAAQRRAICEGLGMSVLESAEVTASALISEATALLVGAHGYQTEQDRGYQTTSQHDVEQEYDGSYQYAHDFLAKYAASQAPDVLVRIGAPKPATDN